MQKNDKAYAFLLSHRTRSRIYFKRVEVSKHFLYFGSFGTFIILGITALSFGTFRILNNTALLEKGLTHFTSHAGSSRTQTRRANSTGTVKANDFAFNSGGPEEDNELDGGEQRA